MVERIRDLIERFPEDERLVRELVRSNAAFGALCQEYKESADELDRLQLVGGSTATSESNWLKRRQPRPWTAAKRLSSGGGLSWRKKSWR